jgi:hypothetical protein
MPRKDFGEFIEFFLKGLNPFKNSNQIQIGFVYWIFISKSIWNLKSFPKGKLFLLKLLSSVQSLDFFFETMEVPFFLFYIWISLN